MHIIYAYAVCIRHHLQDAPLCAWVGDVGDEAMSSDIDAI